MDPAVHEPESASAASASTAISHNAAFARDRQEWEATPVAMPVTDGAVHDESDAAAHPGQSSPKPNPVSLSATPIWRLFQEAKKGK